MNGVERTQDEIVARIKEVEKQDFFGVMRGNFLSYLDFEHAKEFLKPEVTKEKWDADREGVTDVPVKTLMTEYMSFAWEKANDKRGLSAARSMDHYNAWLWLLKYEALRKITESYQYYGKDVLVEICKFLGLDPAKWDDGVRENE